jgi:hypothetical protein
MVHPEGCPKSFAVHLLFDLTSAPLGSVDNQMTSCLADSYHRYLLCNLRLR